MIAVVVVETPLTPRPQVYKATLRSNGKPVAVKVQRPGVLETVSLDLHLARELGYQMKKVGFLGGRGGRGWGKGGISNKKNYNIGHGVANW